MTYTSPSVHETAFNCPHCAALAKQFWYVVHVSAQRNGTTLPLIMTAEKANEIKGNEDDEGEREAISKFLDDLAIGLPFFKKQERYQYPDYTLYNTSASRCFNCKQISLWLYDRLIYPVLRIAHTANPDMPPDIRCDFDEASTILDQSPRGAAALLRLAVQKLCVELGQKGKNINDDVGALVAGGLDKKIQMALDAVRVTGNEAVHPGQMDLRDDRKTVETLFKLVNLIVDKMITEPRELEEVYSSLPENKRMAIEARDKKPE